MAKKGSIEKNKRRMKMVETHKRRRERLKAIVGDKTVQLEERFAATVKLAQMPRNGCSNRVRNRCSVTGRPRGYYRRLGVSRIALRELGGKGLIPGLLKSSW